MRTIPLQAYDATDGEPMSTMTALIILIVAFFLGILITRAIFSVDKFLKYQKAHTLLIMKIARAQGVDEKEISASISNIEPLKDDMQYLWGDKTIREIDNTYKS